MPPSTQAGTQPERNVYTVSRLNREVRILIERGLGVIWVQGELSNLSAPSSGHWYFSMKDRDAQLRCAMFRQKNMSVGFTPKSGQQILARGRVSLYEPRGDYQFIVEHLEEAGVGVEPGRQAVAEGRIGRHLRSIAAVWPSRAAIGRGNCPLSLTEWLPIAR